MSRCGYTDDCEWGFGLWEGALIRSFNGRRGQAFLKELLEVLDALPNKRLIMDDLERDGEVCALGAIVRARGEDTYDAYTPQEIAGILNISRAMAAEIMFENDEVRPHDSEEQRFERMHKWIKSRIV
jgi:hypothetical protein